MKHQTLVVGFCIAAGCTYNEYKNYYTTPEIGGENESDAGLDETGNGGSSGSGGGGSAGAPGTAGTSAGSGGSPSTDDCTGCERISVLTGGTADYQLDFDSRRNFTNTLVLFRARVRDFVGGVSLVAYVESGDHLGPEQGFAAESATSFVTLNADSGWQDVGVDLRLLPAFREASFVDAGEGAAGGGFDPGFPFDKARVQRVGLRIQPNGGPGVFTPATLELDSVSFSTAAGLNVDFSSSPGGFELVDPESGSVSQVPG